MSLFELLDKNMDAILAMGERAIADAKRDGVPAHYLDPSLGPGIIRELPDGSRERLERKGGRLVVAERYGPRVRHGRAAPCLHDLGRPERVRANQALSRRFVNAAILRQGKPVGDREDFRRRVV